MRKPLPSRALCRLLLLTAGLTGTQRALAQIIVLPPGMPRDTAAASPASAPDQSPALTVFTPSVTDENGEPLLGVRLTSSTTPATTALTDSIGHASLPTVQAGELLVLSVQGAEVRRYLVGADLTPIIMLDTRNPAVASLKRVQLPFGGSIPPDLTAASTQTIYYRDLQRFPVASFLSALSGQVAGMQTTQGSGLPGNDRVSATLLGQSPTVLIDGIARPLYEFDLEEIESVTVLKDALSTAMLGVRGSDNGVLNITTRRGTPGQPRISLTVQSAIQQPLKQPQALEAYDYARLYNEALANNGLPPAYSDTDLQQYQDGSDPLGHPNVNWRDQVLKKSSRLDRYTFSASGGSQYARYFVSLEHLNQSGLLKTSDINKYNTSNDYKSYVVRSNVDLQLNRKLSAGVHLFGRLVNANDAGTGVNNILSAIAGTPALAYPVYNANGSYGGTQQFQNNIWAQTIGSGYQQSYQRDVLTDVYLKRTLDELTPGLWVRATGSFYGTLLEPTTRTKTFAVFRPSATAPSGYVQSGTNSDQTNSTGVSTQNTTIYFEGTLGYERQLGQHGLNATVLANQQSLRVNQDLPYTTQGISGRASYNYQGKYVAEFAFGLNGVNRYFPNGSFRYGFFPAGGVAWNLSREEFLKSQTWLSALKLYGSYGLTGSERNASNDYFSYIQTYFDTPAVIFGAGASGVAANTELVLAAVDRTWEKGRKLHVGVQGALLGSHLGFTVEYFNSKYYDLLQQRGRNTVLIGNTYPDENIGQNRYSGFTGLLTYQNTAGTKLSYYATANVGVVQSEVLYSDEVTRPYPWMRRTGQPVGQRFGYVADGLFQNAAEIQGAATTVGYAPQPGDIRYKDLNSDGVINQLDQTVIGTTQPIIPLGLTLGLRYGGFDFSMVAQAELNNQAYLSGGTEYAFQPSQNGAFGNAFVQHLDRWTPDNPTASYPRLTLGTNSNNQATSSFWLHSNSYLRLRNLELGYTVPLALSTKARIQQVRLFASATNLLTFSQYDRIDPEVYNNSYPVQRLLNFGLNVKL